jgi:hypothetical protein
MEHQRLIVAPRSLAAAAAAVQLPAQHAVPLGKPRLPPGSSGGSGSAAPDRGVSAGASRADGRKQALLVVSAHRGAVLCVPICRNRSWATAHSPRGSRVARIRFPQNEAKLRNLP